MDSDAKTVDAEAPEREALEHPQWLEAAIRQRGRIDRKRLYRMRPKGMDVLGFEAAVQEVEAGRQDHGDEHPGLGRGVTIRVQLQEARGKYKSLPCSYLAISMTGMVDD